MNIINLKNVDKPEGGHSCLVRPNKLPRKYFIRYNFAKSGKEEAVVTGME